MTDMMLGMTDNAGRRVWHLIEEEQDDTLKLRVYITGGGCSGFQYGFSFVSQTEEDDFIFSKEFLDQGQPCKVTYIVDPVSLNYLQGAEVDYLESLQGAHFTVKNPNAQTTCGCGSSFSV
jgi:iron-sulfur cluster insertion protein